ncbi:hypothetical protein [Aromatoleum evansii]|uniref:hypothetical protein n=1 Tax=Aromatoleum evansii TaxID=59406 RepID=UPI00145C4543|nr:hypothetical protein [Aromatoleum evansii]NMG29327.1 hypothetical protein [Aromatoleum evansii]
MKADQTGTPTEQARYRMAWVTPTERKKAGREQRCATCNRFFMESYAKGDEGRGVKLRCGHPMASGETGMATTENAVCDKWERKA